MRGSALIGWGGPPGPRGTPPSRCPLEESSSPIAQQAGQGPAADQGGRPTKEPRQNKLEIWPEGRLTLPHGRGSFKCACRAAHVSKRFWSECTGYFFAAPNYVRRWENYVALPLRSRL